MLDKKCIDIREDNLDLMEALERAIFIAMQKKSLLTTELLRMAVLNETERLNTMENQVGP